MIKRIIPMLLMIVVIISLFSACIPKDTVQPQTGQRTYKDFTGKTIGVQTGEIYNVVAQNLLNAGNVPEYTSMADMLESLRAGRIDAGLTDSSFIQPLIDSAAYPEFEYIWIPKEVYANESASIFHTSQLCDTYNEWLAGIVADGTMAEIQERWLGESLPSEEDVPKFESSDENGVLRVCDTGTFPPFTYFDSNNQPTGMDYEVISRFAQHLGMKLDITMMEYGAIGSYVLSGKADMSACYLTVTEERGQSMIFGEPITSTQGVLIVPKVGTTVQADVPKDYTAFSGKDIAVITGVLTYNTTEKIGGNPIEYNDSASAAEDVRQGRITGYMHALTAVQVMAEQMDGFEVIPVPKNIFAAQVAGISHDQAVIDSFNTFLAAAEADGTLSDMRNRWFGDGLDLDALIPEIPNSGSNGVLQVAICSDAIPYVYAGANGQYSGFSVELALRFGAYEGKIVEFTDMEFGGLIPYIVSERADIGLANMAITEERKQSVLFTDPFFDEQHGILVLKQGGGVSELNAETLNYTDFAEKTIGMKTGTVWDDTIEQLKGTPAYYSEMSAGVEDVRVGRIDGYITDLSATRVFVETEQGKDFICVEVPAEIFNAPMGAISMNQAMIDKLNEFLAEIKANGIHEDMQQRWLKNIPDLEAPMPDIDLSGGSGTLVIASTSGALPFSYKGNDGEFKGFSIEIALRFAEYAGYAEIKFEDMEFAALIPYVVSGKADFAIADMSITEERKKSVLFTDSIYDDQGGIIALNPNNAVEEDTRGYEDFAGKRLGVITGAVHDTVTENELNATPVYYSETSAIIEDIRNDRLDGFTTDMSSGRIITMTPGNEDLECIEIPAEYYQATSGIYAMDQELIDRFNIFLEGIKADGTLEEMHNRWLLKLPDLDAPMPDIPTTGENGTLTAATYEGDIPFTYAGANGELKGYSIEIARRFAAHEGMDIEFTGMEFGAMIPYVVSGKADLGVANTFITEERKQSVLFTDSVFNDTLCIIALRQDVSAEQVQDGVGFIEWLKTGIERNLITDNRWKMIISGLGVTMIISFAAQIFGTIFGCFICFVLTRKNRFVKWIGNLYCGLIYGTPIVVLLMITYYIIFGNTNVFNVLVAIAAFSMVEGAVIAQNLKGAIETVDPVEVEAARSIGFSAFKAFNSVTLPQAVKHALPSYTNGFIELVKATAIVGYIAIQDLTRAGDIIRSRTYDAYFPLLFIALIYLLVTTVCVQLFKFIIKKINGETNNSRRQRNIGRTALDYRTMRTKTGGNLVPESMPELKKGDGQ